MLNVAFAMALVTFIIAMKAENQRMLVKKYMGMMKQRSYSRLFFTLIEWLTIAILCYLAYEAVVSDDRSGSCNCCSCEQQRIEAEAMQTIIFNTMQ